MVERHFFWLAGDCELATRAGRVRVAAELAALSDERDQLESNEAEGKADAERLSWKHHFPSFSDAKYSCSLTSKIIIWFIIIYYFDRQLHMIFSCDIIVLLSQISKSIYFKTFALHPPLLALSSNTSH